MPENEEKLPTGTDAAPEVEAEAAALSDEQLAGVTGGDGYPGGNGQGDITDGTDFASVYEKVKRGWK